jgi:hypothetical protein
MNQKMEKLNACKRITETNRFKLNFFDLENIVNKKNDKGSHIKILEAKRNQFKPGSYEF